MHEVENTPQLVVKNIGVGGPGIPYIFYQAYKLNGFTATIFRSSSLSLLNVYCKAPHRKSRITPPNMDGVEVGYWESSGRSRLFHLIGPHIDKVVAAVSSADSAKDAEEVERHLAPWVDYITQNFRVT